MAGYYQHQERIPGNVEANPDPPAAGATLVWIDASDAGSISATGNVVNSMTDQITGLTYVEDTRSPAIGGPSTGTANINGLNVIDFAPGQVLRSHVTGAEPNIDMTGTPASGAITVAFVAYANPTLDTVGNILQMNDVASLNDTFKVVQQETGVLHRILPRANQNNRWNILGISEAVVEAPYVMAATLTLPSQATQTDDDIIWHRFEFNGISGGNLFDGFTGNLASTALNSSSTANSPMQESEIIFGAALNATNVADTIQGGTSQQYDGTIGELIVTEGYWDVTELTGWLAHKWGLEGLLPAAHTYKSTDPGQPAFF